MKIAAAREAYYIASSTASTVFRQLALAGVGLIWLLAGGLQQQSTLRLTSGLLGASLLVLTALALDLFQYLWTTAAFSLWAAQSERRLDESPRLQAKFSEPVSEEKVPALARMLNYPPPPNLPSVPPAGNDREIGPTPPWVLRGLWALFITKMMFMVAAFIVIAIVLAHRTIIT